MQRSPFLIVQRRDFSVPLGYEMREKLRLTCSPKQKNGEFQQLESGTLNHTKTIRLASNHIELQCERDGSP